VYDIRLTANGIGNEIPRFGIDALPAGPFTGSFSYNGQLAPNQTSLSVALTSFSLTIGNVTLNLSDINQSNFGTDANGDIILNGLDLGGYTAGRVLIGVQRDW
jgi:hypothetical protein